MKIPRIVKMLFITLLFTEMMGLPSHAVGLEIEASPITSCKSEASFISCLPGGTVEFSAKGNSGDLSWVSVKGDMRVVRKAARAGFLPGVASDSGQLLIMAGNRVRYTAPHLPGTYSVAVTDSHDIAVAEVQVYDPIDAILTIAIQGGDRVGKQALTVGVTQALSLEVWLVDATRQDYTARANWISDQPGIVAVNEAGLLTALAIGKATIFASIGELSHSIEVEVKEPEIIGLVLNPSPMYLTTESTQAFDIAGILQDGRQEAIEPTDCTFKSEAEEYVTVNQDAEVQALVPGQAIISVGCEDLSTRVAVFVNSPFDLTSHPAEFTLGIGEEKTFDIIGGMPPYIVTAEMGHITGSGKHWHYQAPRLAGDESITITDQAGENISLVVTLTKGLVLSPLAVDLSASVMKKFNISGGLPPYKWIVSSGKLDKTEGAEVTYTAPSVHGLYEITVTDNQGNLKTAVINVSAGLMATPKQLIMEPDEEGRFQITGGIPPYDISATAGSYEGEEETYYYRAPSVSGDYQISVTDADGMSTNIVVIVKLPLTVTPSELFLKRNETATLNISGGHAPYSVTTKTGDVSETEIEVPKGLTYTAADVTGQDVITITDQFGAVVQVKALVSSDGLYVSPGESYILPEEEIRLQAHGGTAPYTWTSDRCILPENEGDSVSCQAPLEAGGSYISVTDSTGLETNALIFVYQGELQLSPNLLVLAPGESAELQALLGVPEYFWSAEQGNLSTNQGQVVTYTAPIEVTNPTGNVVIRLEDGSGKVKTLLVVITEESKLDIIDLYAGNDGQLDEEEVERAVEDYFQGDGWINDGELYQLLEEYLNVR